MIRNSFGRRLEEAESRGANAEELNEIFGKGRARKGIFEGDLDEGALEIGQAAALLDQIETAGNVVQNLLHEFHQLRNYVQTGNIGF